MALYDLDITLFNYSVTNERFYATPLEGVEYQQDYSVNKLDGYNDAYDRCFLFIKFKPESGVKKTLDGKTFLLPEDWEKLSDKSGFFTFDTDKDFFCFGSYSREEVHDLETFKNEFPYSIYMIHEWKEYLSVLPHWELLSTTIYEHRRF